LDGAHPYLQKRGLTAETISNVWSRLLLRTEHCAAGLPFRSTTPTGRVVAYAGRWPGRPPEEQPKYRLPRGFRKIPRTVQPASGGSKESPAESLVVVEGFFGCMRVWQAGHRRVVSLMGSHVVSGAGGIGSCNWPGRDGQVLLLFDEDAAGRKGRSEAQERLNKHIAVSVIRLEEGQQPDSLEAGELLALIQEHSAGEVTA
jgi:DNA primase